MTCFCPCHGDDADGRQDCQDCSVEDAILAKAFHEERDRNRRYREIIGRMLELADDAREAMEE